jgi:hypothetical protein
MDRLEDRAAIEQQMFTYARATDWLEPENHRLVFASPHSGELHGPDAIVEWMTRVLQPFEATQHLIGNITITFTGDDTADAVSYVQAWHRYRDREKPDMILWGEYHDRWERIDGVWRIRERRVREAGFQPPREGGVLNPRRAKG